MKYCQVCAREFADDVLFCDQCSGKFYNPPPSSGREYADVFNSFTYALKDPQWFKKMTIGGLITAVPIASAISNGYQMQVIRNLLSGDKTPLPEWDNAGRYFKGGLALTLAIYSLYIPGIILTVVGWIAGMREIFHLITLATGADRPDAVMADLGFSLTKLLAKLTVGGLLSLLLMPIVFLSVPAMVIRCVRKNSFFTALNIFANIKFILKHLGDYAIAWVSVFVMLALFSSIAGTIGAATVWILGIGALVAWFVVALARFWGRMMWAYHLAQMEKKSAIAAGDRSDIGSGAIFREKAD
jgi:Protein of unknown function (DUF4013)